MNDGISTIISFVTKYAGAGAEAAVSGIGKVSKACSLATRGAMSIASSLGSADSAFTKTARSALQLFTSIQQLGAIGGIIAGAQILIEKISEHFIQAAEKMVEKAKEMGDRIREKLDKINQARMDYVNKALEEATVKAKEAANAFDTLASAYMRVQQAVDADKKRADDMKAFRKAVNRYGGQGKINEYAQLMREGDEEGMQSRLAEWRKSSRFTPQVEQMVKAAAADQNRNAAEKSLANIEKNTADLAKKLDDLLSVK